MTDPNAAAVIVEGVRTPRGRAKADGALHPFHPQELLAQMLVALAGRSSFDPADVDDAIIGCASGAGDHDMCIGRMGLLVAGWPDSVPGLTVNRFCGSGQQAVNLAAMAIAAGEQRLVVAGGVESMSHYVAAGQTMDAGNRRFRERRMLVGQGVAADLMATIGDYSREDLDAFAKRSHDCATVAQDEGRFDRSIVPVRTDDGAVALDRDESPRRSVTMDALASLKPAFAAAGSMKVDEFPYSQDDACRVAHPMVGAVRHLHHAGNSSGRSDGAAVMLLASPAFARDAGLRPRARIRRTAVLGGDPITMLAVPPDVSRLCLDRAGMTVDDIDLWEINEAFAVVPLETARKLVIDPDRVNVNGGAIALGHPIGATGPMLIQTALDELERRDLNTALITMCTGAGMATATIIERI